MYGDIQTKICIALLVLYIFVYKIVNSANAQGGLVIQAIHIVQFFSSQQVSIMHKWCLYVNNNILAIAI